MTQKRSYAAGSFELQLDGKTSPAYVKSVDGGHIKTNTVDEPIGPENMRIKHQSTTEIEPISMDLGMANSQDVLKWIQGSWRKDWTRRNGQVTHADFDLYKQFEHEFYDALIQETTFPALDGGSKDPAYLKIKILPEHVIWKKANGTDRISGKGVTKQKLWLSSSFRLMLDGVDGMEYTNKIDAFTIKQGIKKFYTGAERLPQIEPTNITFPNISGTMSLEYADGLLAWHEKYIQKGQADTKAQKTGSLEFLSPDKKSTIFRINLYEVGLVSVQVQQNTANENQIKRVKFEMYVGRMDLDGSGQLGME